MKVKIGPYIPWIGPYQIANLLKKFGVSEETCDNIGDYISFDWIVKVCQWIHNKRQRTIKVVIHDYDVWNLDCTLALIILPALRKFKEDDCGRFFVQNDDVPDHMKSDLEPCNVSDELITMRYKYIINEIIYSFEQKNKDDETKFDLEKWKTENARVANGFRLFGKYYEGLWT